MKSNRALGVLKGLALRTADTLKEPWQMTREEARNQLLFHGTLENIEGPLRGGDYDEVFWTAETPSIAQNYIPTTGLATYFNVPYDSEMNLAFKPGTDFSRAVLRQMGYGDLDPEFDSAGKLRSWKGGGPTHQDVDDWILGLGYVPNKHGTYKIRIKGVGDNTQIFPADYKAPGTLFLVWGKDKLKIYDMSDSGGGDLTDLQYHKLDTFKVLEREGYDGVRINDFTQSEYYGNYGHHSIGLFPSGLAKIHHTNIPAVNFDWDTDSEGKIDTPEFEEWHESQVRQALEEGKLVPQEVLEEYPDLNRGVRISRIASGKMKTNIDAFTVKGAGQCKSSSHKPTTQNEALDYVKGMSQQEMEMVDVDILDLAAFGLRSGDLIRVPLVKLVPSESDLENTRHKSRMDPKWDKTVDLSEPIRVKLKGGRLHIVDGHHRYVASFLRGIKDIGAIVEIADNPITALTRKFGPSNLLSASHAPVKAREVSVLRVLAEARRQEQFQLPRSGQDELEKRLTARNNTKKILIQAARGKAFVYAEVPADWIRVQPHHIDYKRQDRLSRLGGNSDPIFILGDVHYEGGTPYLVPDNGNNRTLFAQRNDAKYLKAYVTREAWEEILKSRT